MVLIIAAGLDVRRPQSLQVQLHRLQSKGEGSKQALLSSSREAAQASQGLGGLEELACTTNTRQW